jgi:hemoglobin
MKDITTRVDVEILVNRFYEQVRNDELLAPVFSRVDWVHHLPVMYNFWSSVLLGDQSYTGNAFGKHQYLALSAQHFTRWLQVFTATVDEHFEGFNANEAKNRAAQMAQLFQYKLGLLS